MTNAPVPTGGTPAPPPEEIAIDDLPPEEQAELLEMAMEALGLSEDEQRNPSAAQQRQARTQATQILRRLSSWASQAGFNMAAIQADPALAAAVFDQYQQDSLSLAGNLGRRSGNYNAPSSLPSLVYELEQITAEGADSLNLGLVAPIMIVLLTDLLQEVARVLREVMTGEARLRGNLVELINESGQAAAEATYLGAMEEAQKTREQAISHFANAMIGIATVGAMWAARGAAGRSANRSKTGKTLAAKRQQQTKLDNQYAAAKRNADSSAASNDPAAQQAARKNDPTVQETKARRDQNRKDVESLENQVRMDKSERRQMATQSASQVGTALQSVNSGIMSMLEAAHIEDKAEYDKLATLLNLMVQIVEKMYSASSDSSQKAWQLLQDVNRALEEIKAIVGKIGWAQP